MWRSMRDPDSSCNVLNCLIKLWSVHICESIRSLSASIPVRRRHRPVHFHSDWPSWSFRSQRLDIGFRVSNSRSSTHWPIRTWSLRYINWSEFCHFTEFTGHISWVHFVEIAQFLDICIAYKVWRVRYCGYRYIKAWKTAFLAGYQQPSQLICLSERSPMLECMYWF